MTRQQALEQFDKETESLLMEGKAEFSRSLEKNIEKISETLCQVIRSLKEEVFRLEKEKIMFIHFSILRVGLENGQYQFLAQAMDARWYLDTEPAEISFSLDFLFPMWEEIRKRLTENRQKYLGKVNRYDVEHRIAKSIMDCNSILAQTLRFIFRDIEENPDFAEIQKLNTWGIYWGEYRDYAEIIAYVNREKKTQLDWDRALRQTKNEESSMVSGYWYQAELKDSDCRGKILYFIQFEDCILENLCFDEAVLTGARFKGCRIKNCSFRNTVIHQADFSGCTWEDNHFEGADMTHSVFMEEEIPFIHLEADQLQTILVDRRRQQ